MLTLITRLCWYLMADFSTVKLFLFLCNCKVYFKNLLIKMTYQLMDAGRPSKISHFLTLVPKSLLSWWGLPGGSVVKNPPASVGDAEDTGLIPGSEWSPGEGNGNPFQYSCLEKPWTEDPSGLQSTVTT